MDYSSITPGNNMVSYTAEYIIIPRLNRWGDKKSSNAHYRRTVGKIGMEMRWGGGAGGYVQHGETVERREGNAWDMLEKDGNQRNARQAEREVGSEQWRAAGVGRGQTGFPWIPAQRGADDEEGREQRGGGRGSKLGSRDSKRQDRKEWKSAKREGVRNKVSKYLCRCTLQFEFPAHLPACHFNCQTCRNAGREKGQLAAVTFASQYCT